MPELPEVESVRRSVLPHLLGRSITRVDLLRPDIIDGDRSPRALMHGGSVAQILRRGKLLAFATSDTSAPAFALHLGMTGQLLILPAADPRIDALTHVHLRWHLAPSAGDTRHATPMTLLFRDPRRFGGLFTHPSLADLIARRYDTLGPDALEITPAHLAAAIGSSTRAIKAALLDQTVLAGVGNIYADEALFIARINPRRRCKTLRPHHFAALTTAIVAILNKAITAGGSTLRDYRDADGQAGSFALEHHVYGRAGLPCTRCQTTLKSTTLAQRTTVWCPQCQPMRDAPI